MTEEYCMLSAKSRHGKSVCYAEQSSLPSQ